MGLSLEDKLRGASFYELVSSICSLDLQIYIHFIERSVKRSYTMKLRNADQEHSIGLLLKNSNKRRSPWQYTFLRSHQEEVQKLNINHDVTFVLFLNGDDGVACVRYTLLKQFLGDNFEDTKSVRVSRKLREAYRISGRDGKLTNPLPMNSFPNSILEWITETF